MTAAQIAQYGPDAFNVWIDAQVNGRSRHRARMARGWVLRQPLIAAVRMARDWMLEHPRATAYAVSAVFGFMLTWKVYTR